MVRWLEHDGVHLHHVWGQQTAENWARKYFHQTVFDKTDIGSFQEEGNYEESEESEESK